MLHIWLVRWWSHVTRYVSSRNRVFNWSDSLKYMKKIMDVSHKKKTKAWTPWRNSSELWWTFKDPWFRSRTRGEPGAREKSASPAWPATSAKNSHIYIIFFLPCYICHYIVILCKNIRIDSKFKTIAPPPWLLEKIIWNCVLSRTARLYTVITHNVPGNAICVPIVWCDSLYLNNLHLNKHACKVVLNFVLYFHGKYPWTTAYSS